MRFTYWSFEKECLARAWKIAWRHFAPTREHIPLLLGIGAVTFCVIFLTLGKQAVTDEALDTAVKTLLSPAVAFALWFVLVLFAQPYQMWAHERKQLKELKKSLGNERNYREVAKKIENFIYMGQVIVDQYQADGFVTAVITWVKIMKEQLGGTLTEEDRAMLYTLIGPMEQPEVLPKEKKQTFFKQMAETATKNEYLEKLNRAMAKLRMIMARYYRAAEKYEAPHLERDPDNQNVDTS